MHIILGSQSPRRRELMAGLDLPFDAISIDADETYPAHLQGGAIPQYIAQAKAQAYAPQLHNDELLITADTIVWLNGRMLGKPHSVEEAKAMLQALSGQTHVVYTGVYMMGKDSQGNPLPTTSFVAETAVTFRTLTEEEIDYYVTHYRPMDKAGAYGVQEWIGYVAVTHLDGSFYNVMGFPIARVYEALQRYLV